MQHKTTFVTKWSDAILWKFRWKSPNDLFEFLNTVDNTIIARYNMGTKSELIKRLERAIVQVETMGHQNKEARAMTAPGALFESWSFERSEIRADYMEKRKRLNKLLQVIGKNPAK